MCLNWPAIADFIQNCFGLSDHIVQKSIIKILKTNAGIKHVSHYCMVSNAQVPIAGNIHIITPQPTYSNLDFLINRFTGGIKKMIVLTSDQLDLKHDRFGMVDQQVKLVWVQLFDFIDLRHKNVDFFFMELKELRAKAFDVPEVMIEARFI
jgi:hypothetical protein